MFHRYIPALRYSRMSCKYFTLHANIFFYIDILSNKILVNKFSNLHYISKYHRLVKTLSTSKCWDCFPNCVECVNFPLYVTTCNVTSFNSFLTSLLLACRGRRCLAVFTFNLSLSHDNYF